MADWTSPDLSVELTGGVRMPLLGLGTWRLSGADGQRAVEDALAAGYRHIDTATMYGNEREVGAAVAASGLPRDDVFVTTKLPPERADRPRETLERSLAELGFDRVDLWLIHWPPGGHASPQTWRALLQARDDGLARAVGVSNYSLAQVDELVAATGEAPAADQVKWAPALFDRAFLDGLRERGVALEGYSPFRAGQLDDPVLFGIAEQHGVEPAQVVVRWHLQHRVAVIPKSSRPERIARNADVLGFELTAAEMEAIDALGQ